MKKSILPCLLFVLHLYATAQDLPDVSLIKIHSAVLSEERRISIYRPPKMRKNNTYPVLFLFDAEYLFQPLLGTLHFMNYGSSMPQVPECYIVGIHNTKRDRDMPVPQAFSKTNGAANFSKFISTELLPFLTEKYSNLGVKVLIGHSQGGLFATYAGLHSSGLFPFVLSIDAPITVDSQVQKELEQKIMQQQPFRYVSVEQIFGWKKDFLKQVKDSQSISLKIENETHETVALKGFYEGLRILFHDYVPSKKDLSLPALKEYYQNISTKYFAPTDIPAAVLLQSAREKIGSFKKEEALELLSYFNASYGSRPVAIDLEAKAKAITKAPDSRVDFYLNHPSPSAEEIKPFKGKWKGLVQVPGGTSISIEWEIREVNGKYIMDSRVMDEFNSTSDFLLVSGKKELVWGRKHNGGGIYLSIGALSPDGNKIIGTEDLIGFHSPEGITPFRKNSFEFEKVQQRQ
ncbi:MAG TPA: alpha/beta hydrolase-fold protein [Chitinophagaceae bacterium]|nr:alpha/beta hydrolase-fold protein [Chitinophagaceae bacterium]